MQNFLTELDELGVARLTVHQSVRPSQSRTHLVGGSWDWRKVRDYVVCEIERRQGPQSYDHNKLIGIFKGFVARWGEEDAKSISEYVFEMADGVWQGRPVAVTSWCSGADPYFATPIAQRLVLLGC